MVKFRASPSQDLKQRSSNRRVLPLLWGLQGKRSCGLPPRVQASVEGTPSMAVVVQLLSHVWLFAIPWPAALQTSLSFTISWSLLKLMSIELMVPSNHLILCHLLLFMPSIVPSIRVLSNELALHIRWSKYWSLSFSFSTSPSNQYSVLISFRIDWFDLLAV